MRYPDSLYLRAYAVPYRRHGIRGWIDGLRSPRTAMDSVRFAGVVLAVVAVGLLIGAAR